MGGFPSLRSKSRSAIRMALLPASFCPANTVILSEDRLHRPLSEIERKSRIMYARGFKRNCAAEEKRPRPSKVHSNAKRPVRQRTTRAIEDRIAASIG